MLTNEAVQEMGITNNENCKMIISISYMAFRIEELNIYVLYQQYAIICGQADSRDDPNASALLYTLARFPLSSHSSGVWRESTCCSHQTRGWTLTFTMTPLPCHNYLQINPIDFQERGLNPGPHEPVDSKTNCYNH